MSSTNGLAAEYEALNTELEDFIHQWTARWDQLELKLRRSKLKASSGHGREDGETALVEWRAAMKARGKVRKIEPRLRRSLKNAFSGHALLTHPQLGNVVAEFLVPKSMANCLLVSQAVQRIVSERALDLAVANVGAYYASARASDEGILGRTYAGMLTMRFAEEFQHRLLDVVNPQQTQLVDPDHEGSSIVGIFLPVQKALRLSHVWVMGTMNAPSWANSESLTLDQSIDTLILAVPSHLERIPGHFNFKNALKNVDVKVLGADSLVSIGRNFLNCIHSIEFPLSMTKLVLVDDNFLREYNNTQPPSTVGWTQSLETISFNFLASSAIEKFSFETFRSLKEIRGSCLSFCRSLEEVDLGGLTALQSTGSLMLGGCTSLTSINCGQWGAVPAGTTLKPLAIGDRFAYQCDVEKFNTAGWERVTSIGGGFFEGSSSLSTMTLCDMPALTQLGTDFLRSCSALRTLVFRRCSGIKSINERFLLETTSGMSLLDVSGLTGVKDIDDNALQKRLSYCARIKTEGGLSGERASSALQTFMKGVRHEKQDSDDDDDDDDSSWKDSSDGDDDDMTSE